jgi:ABC-type dipeptide/oligopeptide/nickel transport system permease component
VNDGIIRFIARRLVAAALILLATSFLTFVLTYLAPGDPATLIVARRTGRLPTPAEIASVRAAYGLDQPLVVQYGRWLGDVTRGDWGRSLRTSAPVVEELGRRSGATLLLAGVTTLLSLAVGIPAGFLAAMRERSWWDHLSRLAALVFVSIPNFWLAFLLILVFSVELGWLPSFGMRGPASIILPVLSLGLTNAAYLSRLTHGVLSDARAQDYMRTARAKGLGERGVWLGHALPNVAVPLITLAALQFGGVAAGTAVIETVFAWPGVGSYFVAAVGFRDVPAIQATVLWFAGVYVLLNLVADVLYSIVDPRLRWAY